MQEAPPTPSLAGLTVYELPGETSSDLTRVVIAFAGLLAHKYGASVFRVAGPVSDPIKSWSPTMRDGSSATDAFLNGGKIEVAVPVDGGGSVLVTDQPEAARNWTGPSVLVSSEYKGIAHSELTASAEVGLLDVFAGADGVPLPLPGHQLAYSTGLAAYNAIIAQHLAWPESAGWPAATVNVLDVALWVNWKHYMAARQGTDNPGIGREEEWMSLPCSDGFITLVFQDKDVPQFAELIGDPFFRNPVLLARHTRRPHLETFVSLIADWAAPRTRDEIISAAGAARIPLGPVLLPEELGDDPQFTHRGFLGPSAAGGKLPRLPLLWTVAGKPEMAT